MAPIGVFLLLLALRSSGAAVGYSQGSTAACASNLPNKTRGGWSMLLQKRAKLVAKVATEDPILDNSPDEAETEEVMSKADEAGENGWEEQTLQTIQAVSTHQGAGHSLESSDPTLPFPFELPSDLTSGYTGVLKASSFLPPSSLTGALAYYKVDEEKVHLLLASNSGFAGFGMNWRGPSMRYADIVVCREHKAGSGEITAADYYAPENAAPNLDAQDWVTVQGGRETMAPPPTVATQPEARPVTWCKIERSRTTCEKIKDVQLTDPSRMLYGLLAWSDPMATTDALVYLGPTQWRVQTFSFSGEDAGKDTPLPAKSKSFTLSAPDVQVPSEDFSSVCSFHKLRVKWNRWWHMIKYKVIRDKESPSYAQGLQHHIDVNKCMGPMTGVADGAQVSCAAAMKLCSEIMLSGPETYSSQGSSLPEDAGIPIGKPCMYVIIRRHFYNPTRLPEVWDKGTKLEITATKELRPKDMRVLPLETTHINIPAGETGSVVSALCPAVCTNRLLQDTQVRRVAFHMHGHGRLGRLRHFRDGQELEPVAEVVPWDVSQASFEVNAIVKQKDTLKLECVYDNHLGTSITYGSSAEQEMCMVSLTVLTDHGLDALRNCSDLPWHNTKPDKMCRVGRRENGTVEDWRPECNHSIARTYCPDGEHPSRPTGATLITEDEHEEFVTPYVAPSDPKCSSPGNAPGAVHEG